MNGAFDRRVFRRLELGTSLDWNLAQAQLDESLREVLLNLLGPRLSDTAHTRTNTTLGFLTESFQVRPTSVPSANAQITAGIGFVQNATDVPQGIGGLDGLNDVASLKPLVLKATQPLTVSAAPAFPNSRIDIVEVQYRRDLYDSTVVRILDPASSVQGPQSVLKTLSFALDGLVGTVTDPAPSTTPIGYKVGVPGPVPAAPSTTPGYVKIAQLFVANAVDNPAGTLTDHYIADHRPLLFANGRAPYWVAFTTTPGPNPPTLVELDGPPGIRMAVTTNPYLDGAADVYFLCAAGSVSYAAVLSSSTAGVYDVRDAYSVGTLSAGEQTDLESASTFPSGLKVAEGSPRIKLTLTPYLNGAAPVGATRLLVSGSIGTR